MTMNATDIAHRAAEIDATCSCENTRRTMRAVTRMYDAALAPAGLKASQFSLLLAIAAARRAPLGRLADAVGMDRTTLSRNLRPLERRKLIRLAPGEDRRSRFTELTTAGVRSFETALPLWEAVQHQVVEGLGRKRWHGMLDDLGALRALTPAE